MFLPCYKRLFIACILVCQVQFVLSQRDSVPDYTRQKSEQKSDVKEFLNRLYWGGNVGAWIGNPSFVDLSPLVGVKVTNKFSIGFGFIYNYYSYKYGNYKYSTNLLGSRIYARYFILDNVFAQVGWDHINRDDPYAYFPNTRVWVDNILVGGGVRYEIGSNFYAIASGLWNLNQTPLSPYANPIIQIGFIGGF